MTAMEGDAQNLFYNPAGMAWQRSFVSASMATTQWIAGIEYYAGSLSLRPGGGRLGVFGLSFMSVDFGDLEETIRFDNDQGFLDIGTFNPTSWVVGFGYARPLSDRFSAGGHVKYAVENLAESITGYDAAGENEYVRSENNAKVYAFDFGVLYRTGFHSLNFAVNARNFSEEIAYEEESFQLPLTLSIGVSMDVMDLLTEPGTGNPYGERNRKTHALRISLDASNPRDFPNKSRSAANIRFCKPSPCGPDTYFLRMYRDSRSESAYSGCSETAVSGGLLRHHLRYLLHGSSNFPFVVYLTPCVP